MANSNTVALSPPGRHGSLIGFFERVPVIAGCGGGSGCGLVLVGWALGLPFVTTPRPGRFPMLPLTALCLVLARGSLTMAMRPHRSATTEAVQQSLAALV